MSSGGRRTGIVFILPRRAGPSVAQTHVRSAVSRPCRRSRERTAGSRRSGVC